MAKVLRRCWTFPPPDDTINDTRPPSSPGVFVRLFSPCSLATLLLAPLLAHGAELAFTRYFGGSGSDSVTRVATDSQGNLYLAGSSNSIDFPTTTGVQPNPALRCWPSRIPDKPRRICRSESKRALSRLEARAMVP